MEHEQRHRHESSSKEHELQLQSERASSIGQGRSERVELIANAGKFVLTESGIVTKQGVHGIGYRELLFSHLQSMYIN